MANNNKNNLLPAYLIFGDDDLKKQRVLERLIARVGELGPIDFNMSKFGADSLDVDVFISDCNTVPFGAQRRLVILEGADKLKKDDTEALLDYLKEPADMTVLAICANSIPKNSRIYKAVLRIDKSAVIECAVDEKSMVLVVSGLAKDKGINLSADAAKRLVALIGLDTVRANQELEKLALRFGSDTRIGAKLIEENVHKSTEPKPWDLTDAIGNRNVGLALRVLDDMPSQSPFGIVAMIANRVRDLMGARHVLDIGGGPKTLAELGVGKSSSSFFVQKKYLGQAAKYSAHELRCALFGILECEKHMKSGREPKDALQDWIIKTCS